MPGNAWSVSEIAKLREAANGDNWAAVAKIMGRSKRGVSQKAAELGIKHKKCQQHDTRSPLAVKLRAKQLRLGVYKRTAVGMRVQKQPLVQPNGNPLMQQLKGAIEWARAHGFEQIAIDLDKGTVHATLRTVQHLDFKV
jgi:hypothetical protein